MKIEKNPTYIGINKLPIAETRMSGLCLELPCHVKEMVIISFGTHQESKKKNY